MEPILLVQRRAELTLLVQRHVARRVAQLALRHAGVNPRVNQGATLNTLQPEQHAVLRLRAQPHAARACQHVAPPVKVITPACLHAVPRQPAAEHVETNPHATYRLSLVL